MRRRNTPKKSGANHAGTKRSTESMLQNNETVAKTDEELSVSQPLEGPDYREMSKPHGPPTEHFLNLVSAKMDSKHKVVMATPNFLGEAAEVV